MLTKEEFLEYKSIIEDSTSEGPLAILQSGNPEAISRLGGEMSAYYARLSGELATIKDEIMKETFRLSQTIDDKGKPLAVARAEMEGEINVNAKHPATRREIEYCMDGIDKIAFACSARVRSFNKEGSF